MRNDVGAADESNDGTLLITVDEAARRLSIGRSHIYEHLARGSLRSLRIGRSRRIAVRDLEAFIGLLLQDSADTTATTAIGPQTRPVKGVHERTRRR